MSTPHGQPPDGGSGGGRERGLRARAAALVGRLDLRDRVTLATAVVLAGGLAVLSAGALLLLSGQLDHDVSSTLSERADAQQAAVAQVGGRTVVRRTPDDVLDEQAWIFDASGRALLRPRVAPAVERPAWLDRATSARMCGCAPSRSTRATAAASPARPGRPGGRARASGGGGAPGGTTASDGGERIGTVVVGVSLEPYERTEHLALLAIAFLDVCIVAFGALLARRAVGKALQPVADMTAQAADWSEHDLDRRFDLGPPRDELTALSATLDGLLARIASSVRREQRFSAEMAHELRTPLAGVRAEAELALRAPDTPDDARIALERVLRGTDRMQAVIDALLSAARGESGSGGVSDAAAAVLQLAGPRIEIVAPAGVVTVGADQDLVTAALQPLLENALRHAERDVRVKLHRSGRRGGHRRQR